MAKAPALPTITGQYLSATQVNDSFRKIEDSFENTLSLDGSTPNAMQADLDLNNKDIINAYAINANQIRINGENVTTTASLVVTPSDLKYTFGSIANLLNDVRTYSFWATNDKIVINNYNYTVAASGATNHHLTTAGGVKLYIADNVITPAHFGATPDVLVNQGAYIQSAIDLAKASRITSFADFSKSVSLEDKLYYTTQSINLSGIRQPGFSFGHGTILGACANKIVLDCVDSNTLVLISLQIVGNSVLTPSIGLMVGRNSTGRIAPAHKLTHVKTKGDFTLAAYLNGGSEDMRQVSCMWENSDPRLTAYAAALVGHGGMYAKYFPSIASDFQTLPTTSYSMISQDMGTTSIQRPAFGNAFISNITVGANAVVTVDPTELASTGWIVGTNIFIDNSVLGMVEIWAKSMQITAINTGTGQVTTNYNSTGHTAYSSSGRAWGKTGPGMLLGGTNGVRFRGNYILTYGSPSIDLETDFGNVNGMDWTFQAENNPETIVRLINDSTSTQVIKQFSLNLLGASQVISNQYFKYTGNAAGTVRFENFKFTKAHEIGTNAISLFRPRNNFEVVGADIVANDRVEVTFGTTLPDVFEGRIFSYSDNKVEYHGFGSLAMDLTGSTYGKEGVIRYNGNQLLLKGQDLLERTVLVNRTAATGAFASLANDINTQQKYQGKPAYNITTGRPVWATGSTAASVWIFADGTTAHTPV